MYKEEVPASRSRLHALHMADLARTPGVGLFGATRALEWGFRFGPHVHVDCGKAMDRNAIDEVVRALELLTRGRPVPSTTPRSIRAR
jgi:hypothetical protein